MTPTPDPPSQTAIKCAILRRQRSVVCVMLTSELNSLRFFDTMIGGVMTASILVLAASLIVIALLAIYVPTVYIRKTNKMIHLLEQIAANGRR